MNFYFNNILLAAVFVVSAYSFEDVDVINYPIERILSTDEYILCRNCGSDISSSDFIISKSSPVSQNSFNDTLFNKDKVLIQILSSDIFFHFPVFTATQSTCVSIGEWEDNDSWFPGYRWKPCVCPDCGAYVGVLFEPINWLPSDKKFYGLILTNLVGESFLDSLTRYPDLRPLN